MREREREREREKVSSVEAGEVSKWNLECELAYLLRERGTQSEREKKEDWEENKKKQGL